MDYIYTSAGREIKLPKNITRLSTELYIRKLGINGYVRVVKVDFLNYYQILVPLGTKKSKERDYFKTIQMKHGDSKIDLGKFFLALLKHQDKESATLVRVLSESELELWQKIGDLGSYDFRSQTITINTTWNSPTDEFQGNKKYNRAIKIVLTKEELTSLFLAEKVIFGTYQFLFDNWNSPSAPIEFELSFLVDEEVKSKLGLGYQRWSQATRTPSITNPYFNKQNNQIRNKMTGKTPRMPNPPRRRKKR